MDPRSYQMTALGTFVLIGVAHAGFQIDWVVALVIVAIALLTKIFLFSKQQEKSALSSSMALVSLLRTDVMVIAASALFVASARKRFIRFPGSHPFNPSAFALVLITLAYSHAFVSQRLRLSPVFC